MAKVDMSRPENDELVSNVKKTPPVLKSKSKVHDQKLSKKIRDAFIADEVHDVKQYVIFDVVIPAIKRTFRDLVMNTLDMSLFGKATGSSYRTDTAGGRTYVSYSNVSRDRDIQRDPPRSRNSSSISVRDLDRITFMEKEDAIEVLGYLMDLIRDYDVASVGDFLSASKLETNPMHQKWGWTDLRGACVMECADGDGWYIRLPKPIGLR